MDKATITPAERIAALEEQKDRLSDRSALAQQMQVCADNRDALADLDSVTFGLKFSHVVSERLTARAGLTYDYVDGRDPGGAFTFRNLSLPLGVTWDKRDVANNPTKGFYLDAEAKPFAGFGTTGSGLRATLDGRAYRSLGEPGKVVVAARVQAGAVLGSDLLETPRGDLFFSGGGGTVRGQPYRSLGIAVTRRFGPEFLIGGKYFLAGSLEVRAKVSDKIGVGGFGDCGSIRPSRDAIVRKYFFE